MIRSNHYIPLSGYKLKHNVLCNSIVVPEVKHNCRSAKIKPSVEIDVENWIPFFAMWIADGSLNWGKNKHGNNIYKVCIKQHIKTENIVEECLRLLPFEFKKQYHDNKVNFVIHDIRLWHYLKIFGKSRDKFIPSWIKENSDYINLFLEWYRKGDGSVSKNGFIYRTISKQLSEDLQECLFKTGVLYRITHFDFKTCRQYTITASENTGFSKKLFYRSNKNSVLKTPYNGKVWCLNLEKNGFMLLRRNNKPFISGNCGSEFVEHTLDIVEEGTKVCSFLKIQFLESKKRRELFEKYPPKRIWVSSSRIQCFKGGDMSIKESSAICYAWFVWEKGYKGYPEIRWFN